MNVGQSRKEYLSLYYAEHKDDWPRRREGTDGAKYQRGYRASLKKKIFDHYGWVCNCCDETEPLFLTIDHVNNDGADHRRILANGKKWRSGMDLSVYRDIIKREFPADFQILCWNCNTGKQRNGGICPHTLAGEQN